MTTQANQKIGLGTKTNKILKIIELICMLYYFSSNQKWFLISSIMKLELDWNGHKL
jgi:hypothetical protein